MRTLTLLTLTVLAACQYSAAGSPEIERHSDDPRALPLVASQQDSAMRFARRYNGKITESALNEISGMAASQRDPDVLWVINDSGHTASLFAIDHDGNLLAEFVTGIANRDWESMTSLTLDDQPYLVLGDSGDNLGIHDQYQLHLFVEPELPRVSDQQTLQPVATTKFVYTDGHRNSEAIAWSPADNQMLLISKEPHNAAVYAIELANKPEPDSVFSAQRLGSVATPPQSISDNLLSNLAGVEMSQITGLEIDANSEKAYVLTYRGIYVYTRRTLIANSADQMTTSSHQLEDWATAFNRTPTLLSRHTLSQAEALALSPHTNELWFTSENLPAPLWRLTPKP